MKLCVTALLLSLLVPLPKAVRAQSYDPTWMSISPTPQVIYPRGRGFSLETAVRLTVGRHVSSDNIYGFRKILLDRLSWRLRVTNSIADNNVPKLRDRITIAVANASDHSFVNDELGRMGISLTTALKPEGYLLITGYDTKGAKRIVVVGADQAGIYYAGRTLSHILSDHHHPLYVPGLVMWDWPNIRYRGIVEGFYGSPWSQHDRMRLLAFCANHKMNMWVYAPKDDVYHRASWRAPYPPQKLKELQQLIQFAGEHHIQFVYAISPGLSICYSSDRDLLRIMRKGQVMWDSGTRSFGIFFDDIGHRLHYPEDRVRFGHNAGSTAVAQAYLLNQFYNRFIRTHAGARLMTVPTDYYQLGHTEYRDRFAKLLDPHVAVCWTGHGVVARSVSLEDLQRTTRIFRHPLILWDNYPVNDYQPSRLLLGPLEGRDARLGASGMQGLLANPMGESEASKIPLSTIADFAWNPTAYGAQRSWDNALREVGGTTYHSLRIFAESNRSSLINRLSPPSTLTHGVGEFWSAFYSGDNGRLKQAAGALMKELQDMQQVRAYLLYHMDDPQFVKEARPWLDVMSTEAEVSQKAVRMLLAQRKKDHASVWRERHEVETLKRHMNQKVAISSELEGFIRRACAVSDRWIFEEWPGFTRSCGRD